ncbi:MAG: radical SAM protein [Spirochaetales bacterium]|nr:radical SAM protein [Spirochaetales bacterium]
MIREIEAKSLLRRHKKVESWFLSHYGLNLYRGCVHGCAYCDGRAEKYQVTGEFDRDIDVKVNALGLLERELDPERRRKPMPRSFMVLGGGVCDAYQGVEETYRLARGTLELLDRSGWPVHVLTKSVLVERDLDLLKRINRRNRAVVSFSFSSADEEISRIFEPGVPPPSRRLEAIRKFREAGLACGMFLMPVIPFITDTCEKITETLRKGKEAGVDFVIFGTMTLKAGRQADHFLGVLGKHYPEFISRYEDIYPEASPWGESTAAYTTAVHRIFDRAAAEVGIPVRMPRRLFDDILSREDLVIVLLEHLDYLLKLKGRSSPYGYAAYSLSQLKKPVSQLSREDLLKVRGVGPATAKVIAEILETGTCREYEELMERFGNPASFPPGSTGNV